MNIKAVISIDSVGNIKEYPSMKAAAEAIGVKPSQISMACNTSWRCAGMKWYRKGEMPVE